jgi:Zn-dependent protease
MGFRLGSIPVRVHGSFFLMALLLGVTGTRRDPALIALWVVSLFFSVLLHELGHALTGLAFGLEPRIDLYGMGGLTTWAPGKKVSTGRRIAISLAGPGVGIALGLALGALAVLGVIPKSPLAQEALDDLLWINIGWGVLNLLPMLPLDGGNVMTGVLNALTRGRGERPARIVSLVLAVLLGTLSLLVWGQIWTAFLCVAFAIGNARALKGAALVQQDQPLRAELDSGYAALNAGDHVRAIRAAESILRAARTPELQADALRLLGFAMLFDARWGPLMVLMDNGLAQVLTEGELEKFERAARETDHPEEAERIRRVRSKGAPPAAATDFHSDAR